MDQDKIISRLQTGDHKVMEDIYIHYGQALFGVAVQILGDTDKASDVLQEALISIWQNGKRYDSGKGRLYTWMLNIVRNKAIDEHRKVARRDKIHPQVEHVDVPEGSIEMNVDLIGFNQKLGELTAEKRELIELSYIQGYSHSEISDRLEVPLGTVKTRIRSAMMDLKKIFE